MPSPFPGMDPYLEAPAIWPDFHDHLASEIGAELNQILPPPFFARLEMRPEIGINEEVRGGYIVPDVSIVETWSKSKQPGTAAVVERPRTEISKSIDIKVIREPLRHHFVEIREADPDHKLITLIEILSPSNKRHGPDRESYEAKQQQVLESEANLIEIDLLRAGSRIYGNIMVADVVGQLKPQPDYLVLVNRASLRSRREGAYKIFPISLRDTLPCIPVPLKGEFADVPLDLQFVANRAYDRGPYRRGAVNYDRACAPALGESDAAWANEQLRKSP